MRTTLAAVALLVGFSASAGTITSLVPSTVTANSGEEFLTINGSSLGNEVVYDGPAGTFRLPVNATRPGYVIGWIPTQVLSTPGTYDVFVRNGNEVSGPAKFIVKNPNTRRPLLLQLPEAVYIAALDRKGGYPKFRVEADGGEDPSPVVRCDRTSGELFPLGTTIVNCEASNRFEEKVFGSFPVLVADLGAPMVTVPQSILVRPDKPDGATVKFDVKAIDDVEGELATDCSHRSGSFFPIGQTFVVCTAMDSALNVGTGAFFVEVDDKGGPLRLHVTDLFAEAESKEGVRLEYDVFTSGSEDPSPKVECDPKPGSMFKLGTTVVTCKAEDRFGDTALASFDVTVSDTTPPAVSVLTDPSRLEPTGKFVNVRVEIGAHDAVDPMPRCYIATITSTDPITSEDWSIVSDREVKLLARISREANRIYSISVNCTDESQNSVVTDGTVTVVGNAPPEPATIAPPARRRSVRP